MSSGRLSPTWWVYIIQTEGGTLYTGITTDVARRFKEHLSGHGGAKYFRAQRPGRIVHREPFSDRSSASRREAQIKRMTRREKLSLFLTEENIVP